MRYFFVVLVAVLALAGAALSIQPKQIARDQVELLTWEANEKRALRLVAFGTSLTRNYSWPQDFQSRLSDCLGEPVEMDVVALPGANSSWALDTLDAVIDAAPDLVLIEFAINDADILDGLSLRESVANHRKLIRLLKTELPATRLVLMTMSPAFGVKKVGRFLLPRYYAAQVSLAKEEETDLIDIYARWTVIDGTREYFPDGLHPENGVATRVVLGAFEEAAIPHWFSNTLC